ncbi:MAG: SIR2 family protein [Bacteroidetes bacterium]|nr:SIR2 family protein [Bacteroidota bacterium]
MYKVSEPGIIVSLLKDGVKPIILLGAGASKQSGIKLVNEIVEEVAKWAYCREKGIDPDDPRLTMSDWKKWLTDFPWYIEDYGELYPKIIEELLHPRQARKDFFLKIINPGIPASKGYEALAQLLHLSLIDTVLTTNFDNCLSDAKVQIRKPPVIAALRTSVDLKKQFSYTPRYPQLVYLHGSVEHYTDKNLLVEINKLDEDLVVTLKPLLKDRPLIIVGYRGAETSVMQDLFLNNLDFTSNFHQGIYWCILKKEFANIQGGKEKPTEYFLKLSDAIKSNLHVIPIDGFDELLVNEVLKKLEANQIDLKSVFTTTSIPNNTLDAQYSTYDTKLIATDTIGALEFALLRERIKNYSERLRIKVYDDDEWLYHQMERLRIAEKTEKGKHELTASGILLFSSRTSEYISSAKTIIRFRGTPEWLEKITSFSSDKSESFSDYSSGMLERVIEGNLWHQLNEITDALTLINKPFRLKGEVSENVYPYPTLALKEVIVNSLVHRDYSIDTPVLIEVKENEILFISPGGLIEEVKRQIDTSSIEDEIKKGRRGIKGYRNPVLADLFYGSGAMDKEGSGLSDVYKQITENASIVTFGPTDDNRTFEVKLFRRIEDVDELTMTATPIKVSQTTRFAANILEVLELPSKIYYANTKVRRKEEIYKKLDNAWTPPYLLHRDMMWSFYDLTEYQNPLKNFIDAGTHESMSPDEFIDLNGGTNELVRLLNESLKQHLFSIGLRVDDKKKRAYFTKTFEGEAKEISYQGRLKKATRTVARPRINSVSEKIMYWEHKSIWYSFEKIGNTWYLMINPAYVFTIDGIKKLLKSERVNILSTKKASRDYNMSVHNDLTFWANYISQGNESAFFLRPNCKEINEGTILGPIIPNLILSAKLPTIVLNDISISEEFVEPTDLESIDDIDKEIEEIAKQEQLN